MEPFEIAQIPGDHQISDGLDEGELLENLRNAPIVSPQRSPRFLDVYYLQPSPDFFGLQFGFDTSLPPSPTYSVSPLHDLFTSSRVCVSLSSSTENVHQAALRLQKVYKSFRTRRQLADCAVLVEQIWWKKLDFAELKRSSISFFDIEKPETAVSRWSRARTRAAKVGISKDQRARKLALQHWLEAIDPRHRFGYNLQFYYVTWLHCESKQPFFSWLDIGEGKEVNLERCPRSKLQQQCIKYLGPTERKAYEVAVEDGKFYKQSGKLLDMRGWPQDAKWNFVLSTSKTLYVGQKHKGTFQHSSFLAGGATLSAGILEVEDGILKAVWPHIGHYLPTEENFEKFIIFLEEHNVNLSIVQELRQQLNRCSLEEETSVEIINPSMDEKLDSRQLDSSEQQVEVAASEGDSNSWPMLPCSDPAPKQSVVTIKATYGEDTVKFDLSSTQGIVELKEEVAKRLELESDSFKVKYLDEDQDWILIACDADFQCCLEFSSSLGNQSIRILVVDKVSNFGKS